MTAPLTIKMDPRVKASAAGLRKNFQADTRLAAILNEVYEALAEANSIRLQLDAQTAQPKGEAQNALVDFQKKLNALLGGGAGSMDVTLSKVNGDAGTLYQQIWQVDAEPTSAQVEALGAVERGSADVLKRWHEFKDRTLPEINRRLRDAKVPEIRVEAVPVIEESVDEE
jgi:hypothetical protein